MSKKNGKHRDITTYQKLSRRICGIAQTDHRLMGDFIPPKAGTYWLIGEQLAWHAVELLKNLALELRRDCGRPWNVNDLAKMSRLYLRYPTIEIFSGRCVGRKPDMSLDELLDIGK